MLEIIFQNLINKIANVLSSHDESSDERTMRSRNWEFIFSDFDGWVVLYCSTHNHSGGYWIYPRLHPKQKVDVLKEQLPSFSIDQASAAYSHVMSGEEHWLEPFWEKFDSFKESEIPIFFHRQYYGYPKGSENYYEINQLVTHPLDLHWSLTKNAYCRIDSHGEELEKIKIIKHDIANLILIRRRTLDKLLYLGEWILVRHFSFNRYKTDYPSFYSSVSENFESKEHEIKYEIITCKDEFIEFRGAQIERPRTPKDQLLSWSINEEEEEKKYAEFIIYDWKNKRILRNYSLAPHNFSNYFTKSDLPFETSPIFFKADVLDKYKNNPDKYELTERTITCRSGRYLKNYDINEYNQVHTYAVYLRRLPYKEQLHWLQYNEAPKGYISKRAFQTDFEGKFPDEESKLERLKRALEKLEALKIGKDSYTIWSPKGSSWETATKQLYYVNTENPNQWHDFIIALANTTNEGFQLKPLREVATRFGNKDEKLRQLGLIKFILKASNNESLIPDIHGVLNDLQIKRGKGKAHGSWLTPEGSLIEDANQRLEDVINAINKLKQVFASLELPE